MRLKHTLSYILAVLLVIVSVSFVFPGPEIHRGDMREFVRTRFLKIDYDLKASFDVPNQTFINAQVLDTPGEGVQGSTTVVDTSTGTVKVVSNKLELVGDGADISKTGVVGSAITKALGKAFFLTQGANANITSRYGFHSSNTLSGSPLLGLRRAGTAYTNKAGHTTASIVNTTAYQLLFLLGGYDSNGIQFKIGDTVADFLYGYRGFIKAGTFTNWTLLWIEPGDNIGTLYPQVNMLDASTDKGTFDNILIPTNVLNVDTMFDPAYLSTSTDESDHDTGVSDFVMEVVFDTPGAGTDPLDIRYRKAGTNDHWIVRVTPGTAGTDIEIIEDDSGETQKASADIDWTGTTEYRVTIIVDGDDKHTVYVDGALEMDYTTTNTFNETETVIDLLKNSFTVDMVAVHSRTDSDWDVEISRATGGTY